MKRIIKFLSHFTNVQDFVDHVHAEVYEIGQAGMWGTTGMPADPTLAIRWSAFRTVLAQRLTTALGELIVPSFRRSEWTANPADPTQVIRWVGPHITLVNCTWALELTVRLGSRRWVWTDSRIGNWLYDVVEGHYEWERSHYELHEFRF